jgi:hypothetical protein
MTASRAARSMMPMVLMHLLQPDPRTLMSMSMASGNGLVGAAM